MDNQNKNKIIIILLVVIIVILSVLCILFATDTISFKSNDVDNNGTNENNQINNNEEIKKDLTEEETINIVKNVFTNSTVQYLVNFISVTYCSSSTTVSGKDLGLDNQWNGFEKCDDFHSYEELTSYFKQFVTTEFFNNIVEKNTYLKKEFTLPDGTVMYNYYEKDGNLYAAITGKGSDMSKFKFLEDETIYKIDTFDNNKISATITAKWEDPGQYKHTEIEKITIINDNGNWKVNSYESKQV